MQIKLLRTRISVTKIDKWIYANVETRISVTKIDKWVYENVEDKNFGNLTVNENDSYENFDN